MSAQLSADDHDDDADDGTAHNDGESDDEAATVGVGVAELLLL